MATRENSESERCFLRYCNYNTSLVKILFFLFSLLTFYFSGHLCHLACFVFCDQSLILIITKKKPSHVSVVTSLCPYQIQCIEKHTSDARS